MLGESFEAGKLSVDDLSTMIKFAGVDSPPSELAIYLRYFKARDLVNGIKIHKNQCTKTQNPHGCGSLAVCCIVTMTEINDFLVGGMAPYENAKRTPRESLTPLPVI